MDVGTILLLALLLGVGAAAVSEPEQTENDVAAQGPSFFQIPDFTFPAFPAFEDTPQLQPMDPTMPYWFNEIRKIYPDAPIKVGPSS